jgi:hypothetical protein
MEPRPKPLEEALLARVPDRIARRERAEADVKPDGSAEHGVLADRRGPPPGFNSIDDRPRQTTRLADAFAAQTGTLPRSHEIGPNACFVFGSDPGRAPDGTDSAGHRSIMAAGHSPAMHCASRAHYVAWEWLKTPDRRALEPFRRCLAREASKPANGERSDRRNDRQTRNRRAEQESVR